MASESARRVALSKARRCGIMVAVVAALGLGSTVAAPATHARDVLDTTAMVPVAAQGCNGDACMFLSTPSGGKVYVKAWAYDQTFTGHFHLSGPNGLSRNSPVEQWIGGGVNSYTFSDIPAVVGQYCVTAIHNGVNIGRPCESVE
jgi:hypothetical protein